MEVCPNCFTSRFLQNVIRKTGQMGTCPTCGHKRSRLVDAAALRERFEPLAQFYEVAMQGQHYHVDDETGESMFDEKCGYLEDLLQQDWTVFSPALDNEDIQSFLEEVWPDYDASSLYAAEEMFERHPSEQFRVLAGQLMHRRRFFPEAEDYGTDCIQWIADGYLEQFTRYTRRETWYRGRIQRKAPSESIPGRLRRKDIGAPPPELVLRGGRANPAGISFLYLAGDVKTVLGEVRAEPRDYVGVARFSLAAGLRIFDVTVEPHVLEPFGRTDLKTEIEFRQLVREFAGWLSRHVRDADHELDYVVTQYLTEYVRTKGFDGIKYPSAIGPGINLVLFDPEKAHCTRIWQYEVTGMHLAHEFRETDRNAPRAGRSL